MQDDYPSSCPLDFDAVTARLLAFEQKRSAIPLPPSNEELERYNYEKLICDGAHPAYPIGILAEVAQHPERRQELVSPWRTRDECTMFQMQWSHWREFR